MSSRMDKIAQTIEDAFEDSWQDGYHTGIDEAWDESRNKGYDEGWDDCKVHMDKQEDYDKTSAFDEGWNAATVGHSEAKDASWESGYTAGSDATYDLMKSNKCQTDSGCLDDAGECIASYEEGYVAGGADWQPRMDAQHQAGYDEGYDTAMTNFEADERFREATETAYNNGYSCGSACALIKLREALDKIADEQDDYKIHLYDIIQVILRIRGGNL